MSKIFIVSALTFMFMLSPAALAGDGKNSDESSDARSGVDNSSGGPKCNCNDGCATASRFCLGSCCGILALSTALVGVSILGYPLVIYYIASEYKEPITLFLYDIHNTTNTICGLVHAMIDWSEAPKTLLGSFVDLFHRFIY